MKVLTQKHVKQAEFTRTIWQITPSVEVEELLNPDYWVHVSKNFKAGDRIEAIPEDRHYFAELFVLAASKNFIKVILLRAHVLIADPKPVEEEGYTIKFAGRAKWRVIQGKKVLKEGLDSKEEAEKWLKEHKKEMA